MLDVVFSETTCSWNLLAALSMTAVGKMRASVASSWCMWLWIGRLLQSPVSVSRKAIPATFCFQPLNHYLLVISFNFGLFLMKESLVIIVSDANSIVLSTCASNLRKA